MGPRRMSDFPNLAEVLAQDIWQCYVLEVGRSLPAGLADTMATSGLTALQQACTVETFEQLDALPEGAVIRWDCGPGVKAKVLERCVCDWMEPGTDSMETHGDWLLPALLLWHPGWGRA